MIKLCILLLLLQHFCSVHSQNDDYVGDEGEDEIDDVDQIVAATQQHNGHNVWPFPKGCKYYGSNITEFICSLLCRYSLSTVQEMVSRNMPNWKV